MNDKVTELVEWVADIIDTEEPHTFRRQAILKAREILSYPDLALIDKKQELPEKVKVKLGYSSDIDKGQLSLIHNGWRKVIPLAKALKEVLNEGTK